MPIPVVTGAQITSERRQALASRIDGFDEQARMGNIRVKTMRVCTRALSLDPNFRAVWKRKIDTAELAGKALTPEFQTGWVWAIQEAWNVSSRDPRSEVPFEAAYAHFYPSAGVDNFWKLNRSWLVKELAVEGQAGLVQGERGFGKTNHALYLCELLIKLKLDQIENGPNSEFAHIRKERKRESQSRDGGGGYKPREAPKAGSQFSSKLGLWNAKTIQFPTNISISPKDRLASYFPRASKMSEFVDLMCHGAKSDRAAFSLVVPDEMGFSFNKRRAMTIHNFAIEQLLILIRKFDAGLLAIAQSTEQQLPVSLTGSAQTKVQKLSKGTAIYDVAGMWVAHKVRNIPSTSIDFATRAFAPFAVDLVPSLLVDAVYKAEAEARDAGEEWSDDKMYDAAILFIQENKASDKEVAEGKSGVLRAEVQYYSTQLDSEERPYTAKRIALELEVPVEKVEEIMRDLQKKAALRAAAKAQKAGYSEPATSVAPPADVSRDAEDSARDDTDGDADGDAFDDSSSTDSGPSV